MYYERVTSTVSGIPSMDAPAVANDVSMDTPAIVDDVDLASVLRGLRRDRGLQELVPFLSRYVASGLMSRRNLRDPDKCRRLVRVFDAMLDNPSLHLDLHLHQMFMPGICRCRRRRQRRRRRRRRRGRGGQRTETAITGRCGRRP